MIRDVQSLDIKDKFIWLWKLKENNTKLLKKYLQKTFLGLVS